MMLERWDTLVEQEKQRQRHYEELEKVRWRFKLPIKYAAGLPIAGLVAYFIFKDRYEFWYSNALGLVYIAVGLTAVAFPWYFCWVWIKSESAKQDKARVLSIKLIMLLLGVLYAYGVVGCVKMFSSPQEKTSPALLEADEVYEY